MSKYNFKYRLSKKSSLSAIAKAVRALGMEMKITKKGIEFNWWEEKPGTAIERLYQSRFVLDENAPEWINERLEADGLLEQIE